MSDIQVAGPFNIDVEEIAAIGDKGATTFWIVTRGGAKVEVQNGTATNNEKVYDEILKRWRGRG